MLAVAVVLHALWDYHGAQGFLRFASMIVVGAAGLLLLYSLVRSGAKEERHALAALNPQRPGEPEAEPSAGERRQLVCAACGTESPPHARYCARCGHALRIRSEA